MPPRRDIYSSFSDPNSFLGQPLIPRVASAVASGAGTMARAEDQFRTNVTNAAQRGISNLGRLATTIGGALTFPIRAAQEAIGGTPLIAGSALGRTPQPTTPPPSVPAFPSGTGGIYSPVAPFAPTIPPAPEVAQPTRSLSPRPATADDLDAFYRRGAYAPQPTPQVVQPAQRTTIQTPYGTISATAEQAANMNRPRTVEQQSSRSPAEQQALLAQVRQNAANLNRQRTQFVESGIAAGRERSRAMRGATPVPTATGSVASGFMPSSFSGGPQPNQSTLLSPATEDLLGRRYGGLSSPFSFL